MLEKGRRAEATENPVVGLRIASRSLTFPRLSSASRMFAANNKQTTTKLWMWRMEYLHHEQRPLYFGEWF